jgi:hypothetical protein
MAGDQYGECWITRLDDGGGGLRVDRADPVIRISPQLLADLPAPDDDPRPATYDPRARLLRINGVNRTVIYRVRDVLEPVPGAPGSWDYTGEWPD